MQTTLNLTFAALADPTRRAILARLALGEASVNELAEPFDLSQPAISKHLKVLERAGLIEKGRDAQRRPCRLVAGPLQEVAGFAEGYRQFWEQSFDRLDDYMQKLQSKGRKNVRKSKHQRCPRSRHHAHHQRPARSRVRRVGRCETRGQVDGP